MIRFGCSKKVGDWVSTISYDQLRKLARNQYGSQVYEKLLFRISPCASLVLSLMEDDTIPFGKYSCHVAASAAMLYAIYFDYARQLLRNKPIRSNKQRIRSAKLRHILHYHQNMGLTIPNPISF
jgi:hypothetical protein